MGVSLPRTAWMCNATGVLAIPALILRRISIAPCCSQDRRPQPWKLSFHKCRVENRRSGAMACTQRRPDATREAPAVIAVGSNWQLARDRPGRVGWRRDPLPLDDLPAANANTLGA